ncbi:MAG: tetratricopeptide repeat protein, partial [Deltaproteobacteria bacterium]|nr:tetratricopeptide repeat protein [Deltaproteobacteria bacterium]
KKAFRLFLYLNLFFLLTSPYSLQAKAQLPQGLEENLYQQALQGQKLIINRDYTQAQKFFQNLQKDYPNSPLPSFGLMTLYNTLMMENLDQAYLEAFFQEARNHNYYVHEALKKEKPSTWDYFLCGSGQGLQALRLLEQEKTLEALGSAQKARSCFNQALKQDPQFHDAKLGLGLYLYWRSVFTAHYHLPFFKDQRKEGLQLMEEARLQGLLTQDLSSFALLLAYFQEGKSKQGLAICEAVLKNHPKNLLAKIYQGRFLLRLGKKTEAQKLYAQLTEQYPDTPLLEFFLGLSQGAMGKNQEAKKHFLNYLKSQPLPVRQAYTHYQLGILYLREKQRPKAKEHFKQGQIIYPKWKANGTMLKRLSS